MWEELKRQRGMRKLTIGNFAVRSGKFNIDIESWKQKFGSWYLDRARQVAKFELNHNGMWKVPKSHLQTPQKVQEFLGDQCIIYLDEEALFAVPYKKGITYLQKILKSEKVRFEIKQR